MQGLRKLLKRPFSAILYSKTKINFSQEGKIARWWKKGFWQLSMTAWKAAIKNKQTNPTNIKNPTHPKMWIHWKGVQKLDTHFHWNKGICSHSKSSFTISTLPSGQSVLTTSLELALQFQIACPTWSNPQNNDTEGFNSLIIKGLQGFYFRPGLLPLIKHKVHQVSQVGFENAASGFVLGRRNPACISWCHSAMPVSTQGSTGGKSRGSLHKCLPHSNQNIKGRHTKIPSLYPMPVSDIWSPPLSSYADFGKQEEYKSFLSLFAFLLHTSGPFFHKMNG